MHGPWTIEATEEKYRDAFITVRLDRVIRPDGEPGQYATVAMKPGAAILPVDGEGNVFITQQFRYALGWSIEGALRRRGQRRSK